MYVIKCFAETEYRFLIVVTTCWIHRPNTTKPPLTCRNWSSLC